MSDIKMQIPIPTDNDGYVLLQCHFCGNFFKLKPRDCKDDGILELFCPSCGLNSEYFITEDVLELASAMAKNIATDILFKEMKKIESRSNSKYITFKAGKKPRAEPEIPIRAGIQALTITNFQCCKRTAKVKPMLIFTGCYCPFCGVKEYELK